MELIPNQCSLKQRITTSEWVVKYRLTCGNLISKTKSGGKITVFPERNNDLGKRVLTAKTFVLKFISNTPNVAIAHVYSKENNADATDLGEVLRYTVSTNEFAYHSVI